MTRQADTRTDWALRWEKNGYAGREFFSSRESAEKQAEERGLRILSLSLETRILDY